MPKLSAVVLAGVGVLLSVPGIAVAGGGEQESTCVGLTCPEPGRAGGVSGAGGNHPSVSGPHELADQTQAGFYEFGRFATGHDAVAYVVPRGEAGQMPKEIRDLPLVREIADETNLLRTSTVVVFGSYVVEWTEPRTFARPATRTRRKRARAAIGDPPCPDNTLCLYDYDNFWGPDPPQDAGIAFGANYTGDGWVHLGNFGWNDRANSVVNRRDRDSLLNQHNPPAGGSSRYCSESHSSDSDLSNNFGDNQATLFANTPYDNQC